MTAMDLYYPFATGAGATASVAAWTNIATSFREGGISRGHGNFLRPSISGTTVTIDTGSVLVQGCYGESTSAKTFTVPTGVGSGGIMVVQANFTSNIISILYNDATTNVVQSSSVWEYLIARIAVGILTDCRAFMPTHDPFGLEVFLS